MIKLVLCSILLSLFSLSAREFLPHEYEFLPLNSNDKASKTLRIKTIQNDILEFKLEKQECDPYVDNCFLTFSNDKNPGFELSGVEVCFSESCKWGNDLFPNFNIVLSSVEENK